MFYQGPYLLKHRIQIFGLLPSFFNFLVKQFFAVLQQQDQLFVFSLQGFDLLTGADRRLLVLYYFDHRDCAWLQHSA